jgi:hypothetical protein
MNIMKKITLLAAFLVAGFSYGQTTSGGFVLNPSFEDGPALNIPKYQTVDNWKLGGDNSGVEGVSVDIQTTNVYAGEGSKALEVTSATSIPITGNDPKLGEWHIKVMSTAYSFAGNSSDDIEVTVGFWAKTTDTDPASEKTDGDMRLIVRDVASGTNKSARVLLTTGAWAYIEKTFTFDEAANYNLTLFLEFGLVDGVTQIDGITTSVTGGASLATQDIVKDDSSVFIYPNPAMNVLNYSAEGVKNIEVYNLLGQKLKAEKAVGSVNTSTFSKGSYILKLIRENGAVSTKRFVKE